MAKEVGVIGTYADFVVKTSYRDMPPSTVRLAKELLLHFLGGALAGVKQPASQIAIKFIKEIGGNPEAAVIGAGFKSSAINAAFIGGLAPHAIEVEDNSWPGSGSPITVAPVAFAMAEKMGLSGKDIIESFVIGFEVQARIAADCPGAHKRGLSLLSSMGALGAAATAAKMLKLNVNQVSNALGIAASEAAGITDASLSFMTHYFQSGASCRNGLTAAMLARDGFDANPKSLEMKRGLFDIFCGEDGYNLANMTRGLGDPFHLEQIRVKKYPSCTLNHRVNDGVLDLIKQHNILPEQVESIEIGVNSVAYRLLSYYEPKDIDEAKFSLQYNVTPLFLERKLDLADFTNEKVNDPKRKEFMKKVKVIHHPEWDSDPTTATNPFLAATNPVVIKLKDGRQLSKDCVYYRGGPEERLSTEEMAELYRPLARRVLSRKNATRVEELVLDLENVSDVAELSRLLLG